MEWQWLPLPALFFSRSGHILINIEIKWGGAKHDPSDKDVSRMMHPRLSFKALLEVDKMKNLSWNDYEMDAIFTHCSFTFRGSLHGGNKLARVSHFNNQIGHLKLHRQRVAGSMANLLCSTP